jgi:hypothetical protein
MAESKIKIGLVSFSSLGDGLMYLMMAENIQSNGFDVICYGDIAHQLKRWVPHLKVKPYPAHCNLDKELNDFDLVLISPPQFIRDKLSNTLLDDMRKKWILICQKAPESWKFIGKDSLRRKFSKALYEKLKPFINSPNSIRYKSFGSESVVDIILSYMRENWAFSSIKRFVNIHPPLGLEFRRYPNRIIVTPDSAGPEEKNWSPRLFFKTCDILEKQGHRVVLVVSPKNYSRWENLNKGRYEMPLFNSVGDLADFIYESGALIANDSGNGHLASFLGIPVITIYKKRNPNYHWRPDWGPSIVVTPFLTFNFFGHRLWKSLVRPSSVVKSLKKIMDDFYN